MWWWICKEGKMFDDVIRWLLVGLGSQTKAEKRWIEAHPLRLPTDDEQIRKARRVLEVVATSPLNVSDLLQVALDARGEKMDPPTDYAYAALPDDGGDA
jgi:hypothetical protein